MLNEQTAAEQAHALGLEYLGFGGWGYSSDRIVLARTIDGKLVRTSDDEQAEAKDDLGRLVIIDFDDELLYTNLKKHAKGDILKHLRLLKAMVRTGNEVVIMHSRNSEKKVAQFLHKLGLTSGPTLVPYGSADYAKKEDFVKKKIKAGFREIFFFDRDPKAINAIESLKAPFNKVLDRLETHQIPRLNYAPETRTSPDTEGKV